MNIKRKLELMKELDAANERLLKEWKEMEQQNDDKMLAVFVDVYGTEKVMKVNIEHSLQEFYRYLQCSLVDMPSRLIDGKPFVIICDDEGAMGEDCRPSAFDEYNSVMLYGNLLVVGTDEYGDDIRGLTEKEADHIMKGVANLTNVDDGVVEHWQVLRNVTWE